MKITHVCIAARDADALAAFYTAVFGWGDARPRRLLSGEAVAKGVGLPECGIYAIWLAPPDATGPFLEIHQYDRGEDGPPRAVNAVGYGHVSFEVADIAATLAAIVAAGGRAQGEITDLGRPGAPFLAVYARDLEGNIIELEQRAP